MADKWDLFKQFFGLSDAEEIPILTDASNVEDPTIEECIVEYQKASINVTNALVACLARKNENEELLRKLREAVTLAYTYSLDGRTDEVRRTLEKVVNK